MQEILSQTPKKDSRLGRPRLEKGAKRSEVVRIFFTPSEFERIEAYAIREGVPAWGRRILLTIAK